MREKVKGRGKISEIDSQIFKITEMKKNEILEKQNKKLSRLRIARDSSDVSVNKQTNVHTKTAKTIIVKGQKKRKHPYRRKHEKSTPINQNKQTVKK